MTREEAMTNLKKIIDLHKMAYENDKTVDLSSIIETLETCLHLLSNDSGTREQVEKVWPGCVVCKNAKYVTGAVSAVAPHDVNHEIETDAEGDFDFCPVCGRPLTDEAVDMMLKRMEEIYK